jgi:hypothetical protein
MSLDSVGKQFKIFCSKDSVSKLELWSKQEPFKHKEYWLFNTNIVVYVEDLCSPKPTLVFEIELVVSALWHGSRRVRKHLS